MPKIKPFCAWRYNPDKISDFSKVVAPPYDVIGPNKLKELQNNSAHNVVWIDLPQEKEGLGKYKVARKIFQEWKDRQVLIQDEQPCLYLYFQSFILPNGKKFNRKGFFARRQLESFTEGGVKPHEQTFEGPKADRLNLTKATQANLSAIFGLYNDPINEIEPILESLAEQTPSIEIKTATEEHRLWVLKRKTDIQSILDKIHDDTIMIADGHHRYETALNYRNFQKEQLGNNYTGQEGFNDVLMYFCSFQDSGLVVLPTHRVLVNPPQMNADTFRDKLKAFCKIQSFHIDDSEQAIQMMQKESQKGTQLGWIHDDVIEVLSFDAQRLSQAASIKDLPEQVQKLDVTVLHHFVLEEVLGSSLKDQREYGNIQYIKNTPDALKIAQEKNTYGFLMNATPVDQMQAVTEIGATMPQKSTFFYPKILTGLLFNELD